MPGVHACGPLCPFDSSVRTVFSEFDTSLYGWPSRGGCIVLDPAYSCDFEWLGLDPLNPPLKRDADAAAEDEFCERLLLLGAHWWDSEARFAIVRYLEDRAMGRQPPQARVHNAFVLDQQPAPTMREKRLIRVGWPSTGGLWVAEFDTTWVMVHEEDNLLDEDIGRLALVRTMDEKCVLLRDRFQAKFYARVEDCSGYGILRAWRENHTGEVGPLLQPQQTRERWARSYWARSTVPSVALHFWMMRRRKRFPSPESHLTRIRDAQRWLTDVVLLTTAHEGTEGLVIDTYYRPWPFTTYPPQGPEITKILTLDAHASGSTFTLTTGERIQVLCVPDKSPHLYVPVHRACLAIADRFVAAATTSLSAAQERHPDGVTSRDRLWQILHRRLHGSGARYPSSTLAEPHDYFGGWQARNVDWEARDDPEHAKIHEANPLEIPTLTSSVLDLLVPGPPHTWMSEGLAGGHLIPWLWDLDSDAVQTKAQSGSWDWAHLAFSLAPKSIHDPNATPALSPALRNRRRIWRLLEEARIDDVAHRWETWVAGRTKGLEEARLTDSPRLTKPPSARRTAPPGFR